MLLKPNRAFPRAIPWSSGLIYATVFRSNLSETYAIAKPTAKEIGLVTAERMWFIISFITSNETGADYIYVQSGFRPLAWGLDETAHSNLDY